MALSLAGLSTLNAIFSLRFWERFFCSSPQAEVFCLSFGENLNTGLCCENGKPKPAGHTPEVKSFPTASVSSDWDVFVAFQLPGVPDRLSGNLRVSV